MKIRGCFQLRGQRVGARALAHLSDERRDNERNSHSVFLPVEREDEKKESGDRKNCTTAGILVYWEAESQRRSVSEMKGRRSAQSCA